ncbi:MAG: sulfite exporter TauE/SafE family protein [Actinomycetota bacterium]
MTVRALLASPLGFLIGVSLGALGGGGSILAVPVLVFVAGQTPADATTTSLLVVGAASTFGAAGHWRHGRVRLGPGLLVGLLGVAGSLAGSALNRRLDGDVLLLAFAGLIVVAAWRIVAGCPSCTRVGEANALRPAAAGGGVAVRARPDTARIVKLILAGTFVGFLAGLFGVGGGFVIVPALTLVLQYSMPQAIGTSLVVIAVNTATAFAARLGGSIDWATTLLFAAAAIAGVGAGTRIADRIEPRTMQRSFAVLLVAVALYTGGRAASGIW